MGNYLIKILHIAHVPYNIHAQVWYQIRHAEFYNRHGYIITSRERVTGLTMEYLVQPIIRLCSRGVLVVMFSN